MKEQPLMEAPRRMCMDRWVPAEKAIQAAVDAVEAMPADPRLTNAVRLLADARAGVADFVDDVPWDMTSEGELMSALLDLAHEAASEAFAAAQKWPPFNSAHEAFAVLAEEVDELWDEVKVNQKRRDLAKMRAECIQVAAMALRFARDICNEEAIRK